MPRVDTSALKRAYPLTELVASYGVELRRQGRILMGHCPFHDDRTPSFLVDPSDQHYYCFGCSASGDVVTFVQRMEGLDFRAAVRCVVGRAPTISVARSTLPSSRQRYRQPAPSSRSFTERAVLGAAVELYCDQLFAEPTALTYCRRRGLEQSTLKRCQLGYACDATLVSFLRDRGLPVSAAQHVGLVQRDGRERFTGRLVYPELRAGQPIWLLGRLIAPHASSPKYLGLPGPKPLLGWETASHAPQVTLVEGVFDLLVLRQWGEPALALAGTHAARDILDALRRIPRLLLALDADHAVRAASAVQQQALGSRAQPLLLPGVNDVAELALRPDGYDAFLQARAAATSLAAA